MLRLIKNELAKIFYKKSTYVIIIVGILLGIGINIIYKLDSSYIYYEYVYDQYSYEDAIDKIKYSTNSYDIVTVDMYKYLISLGFESDAALENDWRRDAAYTAYLTHKYNLETMSDSEIESITALQSLEQETFDKIIASISTNDYKKYYEAEISYFNHTLIADSDVDKTEADFYQYCLDNDISPGADDWRATEVRTYANNKVTYEQLLASKQTGTSVDENELSNARDAYLISKYRLDNNIEHTLTYDNQMGTMESDSDFISSLTRSTTMTTVVALLMVIVAGGIIANEFSNGTIKFLLINPVKRSKIFWSKYITCIAVSVFMLLFFFIFQFIVALILNGGSGITGQYIYIADNAATSTSVIWYIAKQYMLASVSVFTTVTLAFTISSVLRSSSVAIALSLGVQLAGSTIIMILAALGQDWGRYLLFANTNLSSIINGSSYFPNHSLTFALVNIGIYMFIFLLIAYDGFTRREV